MPPRRRHRFAYAAVVGVAAIVAACELLQTLGAALPAISPQSPQAPQPPFDDDTDEDPLLSAWPAVDVLLVLLLCPLLLGLLICASCRTSESEDPNLHATPQHVIDALPLRSFALAKVAPNDSMACVICLEDFEDDDLLRTLPCRHDFHRACIDTWLLTRRNLCPICRYVLHSDGNSHPASLSVLPGQHTDNETEAESSSDSDIESDIDGEGDSDSDSKNELCRLLSPLSPCTKEPRCYISGSLDDIPLVWKHGTSSDSQISSCQSLGPSFSTALFLGLKDPTSTIAVSSSSSSSSPPLPTIIHNRSISTTADQNSIKPSPPSPPLSNN